MAVAEKPMGESESQGVTRRDLLRRGAVLGGAVVWMTPVVQTIGMSRAFAQTASPDPCTPAISYVAMNVTCGGTDYFIKWEDGGWESDPKETPGCNFTPVGDMVKGSDLGFSASASGGNVTITPGELCTVNEVAVKGGQNCDVFLGTSYTGPFILRCPQSAIG